MSDLTRHLGELMGQTAAEQQQAATQGATHASGAAQTAVASAPASADGVTAAVSSASTSAAPGAVHHHVTQVADAAAQAVHHAGLDAYAFPFRSNQVFGLLPHSVGSKAESLWQLAHSLTGQTDAVSLAVIGILLGIAVVAAISTIRVWKRGDEFAVAGFGDRMTRVGMRYTVRQEAPISAFADKRGQVVATRKPAPPAPAAPTPLGETGQAPREPVVAKVEPDLPQADKLVPPPPRPVGVKAREPQTPEPNDSVKASRKQSEAPPPASEPAKPKTVRRQLFKRHATSTSYAASFHGSYGSFQHLDRLFARDYLRQTNEAFEVAFLKGKGPVFGALKLGDSHRAERLFMMATRASYEDPQTALAALWQAVEEDQSDAIAWLRLAHFYLELGELDRARAILEPLHGRADQLGLDIIVAATANSLAKIAAQRGEVDAARKLFAKALDFAGKTDNAYMVGVASANAGLLEAARGKLDGASRLLAGGVRGFEACEERLAAARTKLALGTVYRGLGDDAKANKVWTEAEDTLRRAGFEDEATQVERWLSGEAVPSAVTL